MERSVNWCPDKRGSTVRTYMFSYKSVIVIIISCVITMYVHNRLMVVSCMPKVKYVKCTTTV